MQNGLTDRRFSLCQALANSLAYASTGALHVLKLTWQIVLAVAALLAVYLISAKALDHQVSVTSFQIFLSWLPGMIFGLGLFLIETLFFVIVVRDYFHKNTESNHSRGYLEILGRAVVLFLILFAVSVLTLLSTFVIGTGALQANNFFSRASGVATLAVGMLTFIYVSARCSTWVVSAAAGRPQKLGQAWEATKKDSVKIFVGLAVLFAIYFIMMILVSVAVTLILISIGEIPVRGKITFAGAVLIAAQIVIYQLLYATLSIYVANVFEQTSGASPHD